MTVKLDEGSSTPLYAQLMGVLRAQIEDGAFHAGERIPSEDSLNRLYGVSRITIRRALKELVDAGYLMKRPGKGTYVSESLPECGSSPKVVERFARTKDVESFTDACAGNGRTAGASLIGCNEVPGMDEERSFFGFGSEGRLLRIERLRTADGTPIMVEENYFPYDAYRFLLDADFKDTSLFDIVTAAGHGEPMLNEPCMLNLEKAPAGLADVLGVAMGEPLFCLFGRYYDTDGAPMYLGKQHIVGSRYTFRI